MWGKYLKFLFGLFLLFAGPASAQLGPVEGTTVGPNMQGAPIGPGSTAPLGPSVQAAAAGGSNDLLLVDAGTGYAAGDTGTVNPYGSVTVVLAAYVIDTVDGGGAVLTYHLSANGAGYKSGSTGNHTTTGGGQPGAGTGFQIDVNSVTPGNGSGLITITYKIVTLP